MKVKICGLTTHEAVEVADNYGADFLGFVFYEKSPRDISPVDAGKISYGVKAKKVAVVVDASDDLLIEIIKNFKPDYIQLHGSESDERAGEIKEKFGIKLIKALTANHQPLTTNYDFLLFDSPKGGSGIQFNYANFRPPEHERWFLSGGLNAKNVAEAVNTTGAKMIDISSGVESIKGIKDIAKIKEFLQICKNL